MSDIEVNLTELTTLAENVRSVKDVLANIEGDHSWAKELNSEPAEAYSSFKSKWDERRDELVDGLRSVAEALELIRDSFDETDTSGAEILEGD